MVSPKRYVHISVFMDKQWSNHSSPVGGGCPGREARGEGAEIFNVTSQSNLSLSVMFSTDFHCLRRWIVSLTIYYRA